MRHPVHDYRGGGYFLTFSTIHRKPILGQLRGSVLHPGRLGGVVLDTWREIPGRFPGTVLDVIQLMPDHVHCIVIINTGMDVRVSDQEYTLSEVVSWFKGSSAFRINKLTGRNGSVWERGYYDRIIRHEGELDRFRRYCATNPVRTILEDR